MAGSMPLSFATTSIICCSSVAAIPLKTPLRAAPRLIAASGTRCVRSPFDEQHRRRRPRPPAGPRSATGRRPARASRSSPAGRRTADSPLRPASGRSRPGDDTSSVYVRSSPPISSGSTSSSALRSWLTRRQSSIADRLPRPAVRAPTPARRPVEDHAQHPADATRGGTAGRTSRARSSRRFAPRRPAGRSEALVRGPVHAASGKAPKTQKVGTGPLPKPFPLRPLESIADGCGATARPTAPRPDRSRARP